MPPTLPARPPLNPPLNPPPAPRAPRPPPPSSAAARQRGGEACLHGLAGAALKERLGLLADAAEPLRARPVGEREGEEILVVGLGHVLAVALAVPAATASSAPARPNHLNPAQPRFDTAPPSSTQPRPNQQEAAVPRCSAAAAAAVRAAKRAALAKRHFRGGAVRRRSAVTCSAQYGLQCRLQPDMRLRGVRAWHRGGFNDANIPNIMGQGDSAPFRQGSGRISGRAILNITQLILNIFPD